MKLILLIALSISSIFADFYLYDGSSKVKLSTLKSGTITTEVLQNIAAMQRQNESVQIITDDEDYCYPFLNLRYVTLDEKPIITVLRDHNDIKRDDSSYLTSFGDVTIKDGVVLQIYYLNAWYGIYLGDENSLQHAVNSSIKNSQ